MKSSKAAALTAAREELTRVSFGLDHGAGLAALRYNLICGAGVIVEDDGSERWTGEYPDKVAELVEAAGGGDRVAHDALVDIADDLTKHATRLPHALQVYVVKNARNGLARSRRGRHPKANITRDLVIVNAVRRVAALGWPVAGEPANGGATACAIVAGALGEIGGNALTSGAVVKIWKNRPRRRGETKPAK